MNQPDLIVIGASARAAAFSAARAGYAPWWIDQFGDSDLRGAFPGRRVPARNYPDGIPELIAQAPHAPWLYTGALENHLDVLERVAALRPLLGNDRGVCERVRDPWRLQACLRGAGIPFPETLPAGGARPAGGEWTAKPLRSSGGQGIRPLGAGEIPGAGFYAQRLLHGEGFSAVYVADGCAASLLGVTQQLVGLPEFHAAPFSYCGSIGPVPLMDRERRQWHRVGAAVAAEFGLRGMFGVDAVRTEAGIVPLEINPRYSASVEVIEHAFDMHAIRLHVEACAGHLPADLPAVADVWIGKAYLFAPREIAFPDPARILDMTGVEADLQFADVPDAGAHIAAGAPIMTLLVRGSGANACAAALSRCARRVYGLLDFGATPAIRA